MDERWYVPATAELLAGWTGPVVFADHVAPCVVLDLRRAPDGPAVELWHTGLRKAFVTALDPVALDVRRHEVRDLLCRTTRATSARQTASRGAKCPRWRGWSPSGTGTGWRSWRAGRR